MHKALGRRPALFDSLLDQAPLGVYVVDEDFKVCGVNPTARALFGDIPGLIGRDFGELMYGLWPKIYADELIRLFRRTLETGEPHVRPEHVQRRPDQGVTEYHEWRISRVSLLDGRYGVACYFRDISAHVHVRERLQAEDRQKNEFLAMLAHELRTPLAPIQNATELLVRAGTADPSVQAIAVTVKRQIGHLARLVDDLLDVSRIAQGRIELRCETVALSDVLSRAIEMATPLMLDRKHTLVSVPSPTPLYGRADPARLTQAIANLLMNSAKYTDPGGKIRTRLYAEGGNAIIEVSDNGAGIAPELLPRLFELFVQGDRAPNRSRDGLGIGLALVRRLVEMHGGTVTAASAGVGAGSTFQIRLPLIEPPSDASAISGATTFQSRRVLIVDDDVDSANTLAMLLKVAGHATEAVYAAHEALERVITFGPDAVLIDIGLPDMNGYELARRMRAQGGSVQLIAVTGYGHPDDFARSHAAGFDAHLVKPVGLPELEKALARQRSPV
jgi:PAS domain S-box-containing protein